MNMPRRIANMAALITLVSTLTAAPIALGAQCDAAVIGPYGTACGGDEQLAPIVTRVTPPAGSSTTIIRAPDWDANDGTLGNINTLFGSSSPRARGFGNVILSGTTDALTTKKRITPTDGRDSVVVVVPGNPTSIIVGGFQNGGTTVQIMLQASGRAEREELGFRFPFTRSLVLPTSTVAEGDRATYTLNEWNVGKKGKVNFSMGLVSQQRVVIVGTGVASGSTNQLRKRETS